MDPFIDGWFVLRQHSTTVVWVVAFMLWGAAAGIGLLRQHGLERLGGDEILSLASAAWIPAALLLAGLALFMGAMLPGLSNAPISIVLPALALLLWIWSPRSPEPWDRRESWKMAMLMSAAFAALLLLRLAFVKGTTLPAYFDSATHFGLIQQLVQFSSDAGGQAALALPVPGYYHLGYHVLVAGLTRLTGIQISPAMLISGQVVLAALPFSLYLVAFRSTGSRAAGMIAVTLGALGWYMPAHAVNWGKYPALFGLPVMLGAISLAYVTSQGEMLSPARRAWSWAAAICALTAVLIHTRLALVLIMLAGAWFLSGIWIAMKPPRNALWIGVVLLVAAALVAFIGRDPIQRQLLDPFVNAGVWATTLVGLSIPLAFRTAPRISLALVLLIVFMLAGLFVPGPAGAVLDRPLAEMLLPLPLSLLTAAGIAGFLQVLPSSARPIGHAAAVLLVAAVAIHAMLTYSFSASACCAMVSTDDLVALDWLRREVPADAQIATAVAPVQISPLSHPSLEAGADAGIWIHPLTGLGIYPLSFVTDFGSEATHARLCEVGVDIVYAGAARRSFDSSSLLAAPEWYELRLQLPAVSVFEVKACTPIAAQIHDLERLRTQHFPST